MIKNVIFDLGNVLINCDPSEYLRKYGYDEKRYRTLLDAILFDSIWRDMDIGKYERYEEIIEVYTQNHNECEYEINRFFSGNWMDIYEPFEDSLKFFDEVYEKGYNIYFLTNFAKDGYEYISNKFDFFKKAKGAVVSSHIKAIKPNPKIYEHLLEKYNLIPNECIFIDDSQSNIETANSLGIHGIVYKGVEDLKKQFEKIV